MTPVTALLLGIALSLAFVGLARRYPPTGEGPQAYAAMHDDGMHPTDDTTVVIGSRGVGRRVMPGVGRPTRHSLESGQPKGELTKEA